MFSQRRKRLLGTIAFLVALTALSFLLQKYSTQLLTSVLQAPPHAPFDGTAYPIQEAPDWVALSAAERNMTYDELPKNKVLPIPPYEPPKLRVLLTSLTWGDPLDNLIRNAKITYPVPYMGSYELDGEENAGSHLAVDIKVPTGTPVYAIANGSILKAGLGSGGSGNQIILQHNDVPDPDDPTKTTTLYSVYLHLSEVLVEPLTTVTKEQLIGKVGATGIATTPHLHFQIDRDTAPFHPYWPFTWKEASEAGLSFFEAINAGLGKDRALDFTVNPLAYVEQFENFTASVTPPEPLQPFTEPPIVADNNSATPPVQPEPEPEPVIEEHPAPPAQPVFSDVTEIHPFFQAISFLRGRDKIRGYDDGTFRPEQTVNRVEALKMLLGGLDIPMSDDRPLDFSDAQHGSWYSPYLVTAFERGIVRGYDNGTFRPTNTVIRAEFLKMLVLTFGGPVTLNIPEPPYPDVPTDAWFAPFVATAKERNFLFFSSGLSGDFLPAQPLTRGEVANMMYRAMVTKEQNAPQFNPDTAPRR